MPVTVSLLLTAEVGSRLPAECRGKAGEADPIETHVYLETGESDTVAQEMLDISEQTCFLHAFCRTDLKTKLKIVRV